jgi:spermidine/putrescine transport system permease protein
MAIFSRTPGAPLEYARTLWMRSWVGAVLLFLYAPLIVLMIFSFNDSKANVVWKGFTTKYYAKLFANEELIEALINSLTIAALATVISIILGGGDAVAFPFSIKGSGRGNNGVADHRPGNLPWRCLFDFLCTDRLAVGSALAA